MKRIRRIAPVVLIALITVMISQTLYYALMNHEKERCWQELETAAQSVNREITTKFQDELTKLHLIEELMVEEELFDADKMEQLHLETILSKTFFSRIDLLFADNTLLSNGEIRQVNNTVPFEELVARGEYLTGRKVDFITGKDCVYYVIPVKEAEETVAILIGYIECDKLLEIFPPLIYNGEVNICLMDTEDGNFIMDSWHDTLGNVYEMEQRELLEEYKHVNLTQSLREHKTGTIAFKSQTTGEALYMYFTPLDLFNWNISIFGEESVLFGNLLSMRKIFFLSGVAEAALLLCYFSWNVSTIRQLEKNNEEIEKQRKQLTRLSYYDVMTSIYNRTKYTEDWERLCRKKPVSLGIAYMDLNGLKQINDSGSHEDGDKYLKTAAAVLNSLCPDQCYRIGGDEFVILAPDCSEGCFARAMELLPKQMEDAHVSVSLGWIWDETCEDLEELLRETEKRMYQAKSDYYCMHDRRRE